MGQEGELQELRKVFAVKSKRAAIQCSQSVCVGAHSTAESDGCLRTLRTIFLQRGHDHVRNSFGQFAIVLAKWCTLTLVMRTNHRRCIAGEGRRARQHLVSNYTEAVYVR